MADGTGTVAALAGRRIDAAGAAVSLFPADRIEVVERAIRAQLQRNRVRELVCAASCGADLLALNAAETLGLRLRIVLPFDVQLFRERSVVDRPGEYPWGDVYDRVVREAQRSGDLVILGFAADDPDAYEKTNDAILDEALAAASETKTKALAIVVWDERRKTDRDYTAHFAEGAKVRDMTVLSISIVDDGV